MADAVEKFFQVDIDDVAIALLDVDLGLGDRLVSRAPRPKAITEGGKRGSPAPLKHLEQRLLDQPVDDTRNPQLAFLLAPRFRNLHPFDSLGLVPPLK